tara:strand:- start:14 stop:340 length:327 start_codon:yes stop_codon:yes gene_type:complete
MTDWKKVDSLIKKLHENKENALGRIGSLYYTYDNGDQIEMFVDGFDPLVVSAYTNDRTAGAKTIEEQLESEVRIKQIEVKNKLEELTRERDNVQSKLDKINEQMEILN